MKWIACAVVSMVLTGGACAVAVDALPEQPEGIGRPASDRGWWGPLAESAEGKVAIRKAGEWLARPMPAFESERYLDYVNNGNRTRYQDINTQRWERFRRLVMGECLEAKGRFIPGISETVASLCGDPSWLLPAHDKAAAVFHGGAPYVDLGVAMNGYQMATAVWLLGERLPAETREMMKENIRRRLTGPVLAMIDGTATPEVKGGNFWARANHNWNAVCTAGAVGAILATEPSRDVRAKAADWARENMRLFLSGFGSDGYCSEGVGYWSFGFGHFVVLAEALRTQTHGVVDLYAEEPVRRIAEAPAQLEIADQVFPAYADCPMDAKPDPRVCDLLDWRLSRRPLPGQVSAALGDGLLYQTMTELAVRKEAPAGDVPAETALPLRTWFRESGVYVGRREGGGGLQVSWKGGNNAEHHNHNDVGTTVVVVNGKPVILDPGAMVYRAETFGKDRYKLTVMSSYAHAVPVPAGLLQQPGPRCRGDVLVTDFAEAGDRMVMQLVKAYPNAGLTQLDRTWNYQRAGEGSLMIEDRFAFASASTFGTALVSLGEWRLVSGEGARAKFLADAGAGAVVEVEVEFSGKGRWQVSAVPNPDRPTPQRLGLSLEEPSAQGFIRMTLRPVKGEAAAAGTKLPVVEGPAKLEDARRAP